MRTIYSLMKIVTTLCLLLALLTACGQRGPLFLPDKSATPAPAQNPQAVDDQKPQPAEVENDTGP